jgi:hypothetical protein
LTPDLIQENDMPTAAYAAILATILIHGALVTSMAHAQTEGEPEEEEAPPQPQVMQIELPDVSLDDVVRAARVMVRENAAFAERRAELMDAALTGDTERQAVLRREVEAETEAAAEAEGIGMDTYTEVMRSVQRHALVSQRFFAALEEE